MRLAAVLALVLAAACRAGDVDAELFACRADADCGEGWVCFRETCRRADAVPVADAGALECSPKCADAKRLCCEGGCVDPGTASAHCGSCGVKCAPNESCHVGRCARETSTDACLNGLDDDGDALVDCADTTDCPNETLCRGGTCCAGACRNESTGAGCRNGSDDDCDRAIDCADGDCAGAACGAGHVCHSGTCDAGCFIGGVFQLPGASPDGRPCLVCDPARAPFEWSKVALLASSTGCTGTNACDGAGLCRRRPGAPCAGESDCATKHCTGGRCVP